MLSKIFKSDKTHNNNRQTTNYTNMQPQQQEHNHNNIPIKKYKFHMLKPSDQTLTVPNNNNNPQTPSFIDSYIPVIQQIDRFQQKSNHMTQFFQTDTQTGEQYKQYPSNTELKVDQLHPMILSDSNANFKPIDRLQIMRIRNYVSDLKQIHMDLSQYVGDQQSILEYFSEKICLQSEEFFIKYSNKLVNQNQQLISNIRNLQLIIRNQNQQIQQLNEELTKKKRVQQTGQKTDIIPTNTNNVRQSSYMALQSQQSISYCSKCKQLQQKIKIHEKSLEQRQSQIKSLVAENQSIQEQIFDLEQRIVGIDLQVQNRLKERTKQISERELRAKLQNISSSFHEDTERNKQIQHLKEQIHILQHKCKRYEERNIKQNQLAQKITIVQEKQLDLHYKQISLKETAAKIQQQKQINSTKERNILIKEDSLSKKKEELTNKEAELNQWQNQLTKRASDLGLNSKDNTMSHQYAEDEHYGNSIEQLNKSKEMSLKSFGPTSNYRQNKLYTQALNNTNPGFYQQSLKMNRKYNEDTQEPNRNQRIEGQTREKFKMDQRQPYTNSVYRNDRIKYPFRNEQKETDIVINKKIEAPIHYRQMGQGLPYTDLRERNRLIKGSQQTPYQYQLPASHIRDSSKNSRGSTSKGIQDRFNRQLSRSGLSMRESPQVSGLGPKLERLRAQIKKQIDSIK